MAEQELGAIVRGQTLLKALKNRKLWRDMIFKKHGTEKKQQRIYYMKEL